MKSTETEAKGISWQTVFETANYQRWSLPSAFNAARSAGYPYLVWNDHILRVPDASEKSSDYTKFIVATCHEVLPSDAPYSPIARILLDYLPAHKARELAHRLRNEVPNGRYSLFAEMEKLEAELIGEAHSLQMHLQRRR